MLGMTRVLWSCEGGVDRGSRRACRGLDPIVRGAWFFRMIRRDRQGTNCRVLLLVRHVWGV